MMNIIYIIERIIKALERHYLHAPFDYSELRNLLNIEIMLDVYHVNGRNTLAENLADLGAVQCILQIPDNDEDKIKIFENYAKIWHSLYMNDYVIASLTKDEHSPDLVRVNSVIMNMDDFQRIFDVQEGDGMYVAPENRVKRW